MAVRPEYFMAANGESPFYGAPQTIAEKAGLTEEPLQSEALPAGWLRQVWGVWEGRTPRDWQPRLQGWKIHISSTVDDAPETLARVTRICVEHQVSFKFLPTKPGLIDANGKQGDRGSSGKLITIYPNDDAQLAVLLEALENTLKLFIAECSSDDIHVACHLCRGDGRGHLFPLRGARLADGTRRGEVLDGGAFEIVAAALPIDGGGGDGIDA